MISASAAPPLRDPWIDTLRGLACLALVSFHTVGNSPSSGMEVAMDHWLAVFNGSFVDMRMPLFSFLSGYVFVALKRAGDQTGSGTGRAAARVLSSKARRLLLPMLCVGLLFWGLRAALGYDQPPLWHLLVLPYAHFWFLQASFGIMTCFVLLAWLWPAHLRRVAGGLLVVSAMLFLFAPRPELNLFAIRHIWYLMPFFMLGYLCHHTPRLQAVMPRGMAAVMLMGLVAFGFALSSGQIALDGSIRRVLTLVLGAGFCLSLLALRAQVPVLAWIGQYSYAIYLFHVFFTAGLREGLLGIAPGTADEVLWIACLSAGLIGPILLQHVVLRSGWSATLLLGVRRLGQRPAVARIGQAQSA